MIIRGIVVIAIAGISLYSSGIIPDFNSKEKEVAIVQTVLQTLDQVHFDPKEIDDEFSENDEQENPTAYDAYPNSNMQPVTLHLNKSGNALGLLSIEKHKNQGKEILVDDFNISGKDHALAEYSKSRLLYVTPKLKEDLHISGESSISIGVSSSKSAANLSVWLVSLPWDENSEKITDNIITRGWADPQNHKSLTDSQPLIPGEFYYLNFTLQPDDQIIREGQQIGLIIFSSDKEFTLHPTPGTELNVDIDNTSLTIPVVGGIDAFKKATD